MMTTTIDPTTAALSTAAIQAKHSRARKPAAKATAEREAVLGTEAAHAPLPPSGSEPASPSPARVSRTDQLIALLRMPDGASIEDLCERFGWLPHSARAALTGLRKRGLDVQRSKAGTVTVYRIAGV
jgi:hypothetical protein